MTVPAEWLTPGTILERMPAGEHELWEYAASNRARIDTLEDEMGRTRDRLHDLANAVGTMRLLGEQVARMTTEVANLSESVERLSATAARRLTLKDWQSIAAIVAALVALAALILATRR